jgi:hypothetical protein
MPSQGLGYGAMSIAGGASFGMALLQGAQKEKAQNKQYELAARENASTNKNLMEMNLQNTLRTAMRVGILNVQAGQARKAAAEQGSSVSQQRQAMLSAASANAAAAGVIGGSVQAIADDIMKKADQANQQVDSNLEGSMFNMDTQLTDITNNGTDSIQKARLMDYSGPNSDSMFASAFSSLASQATNYGMQYAMGGLSLGIKQGG